MIDLLLRELLQWTEPLSLVWLLWTLWLGWAAWRRGLRLVLVPGLAWGLFSLITCTPLSSWLMARLENRHPPIRQEALEPADAIVCLGGGIEPSLTEPSGLRLLRSADRLATALSLALADKAPVLVLGGAGYEHEGRLLSEADAVAAHLQRYPGLKTEVHSLGVCAHTRDEAVKVAALARQRGWRRVLLVTSASHMPRAAAVFAKAGVPVAAVPCNFQSSFHRVGDIRWLHPPHAAAFEVYDSWFHEVVGIWVYRWRGWL